MGDVLATIEQRVAEDPGRRLYCFLDVEGREIASLTREAFFRRVLTIASHLQAMAGLRAGGRALLAYPPGLEMICAFFACARVGIIPTPVAGPSAHGLQTAIYKMEAIAQDCQATAVLTTSDTRDLVLNHLAGLEVQRVRGAYIANLAWAATDVVAEAAPNPPTARHSPVLFLQYTSGSTSQPKGVMVTHDNILANSRLVADHDNAVGVSWLPQHHDMGLIGYYINTALIGGTLYGFSPTTFIQRPALWLQTISKYRATATSAPNFALEYCLRPGRIPQARRQGLDLSSLKFLMAAAEPIKPTVYQQFLQTFMPHGLRPKALVVAYGLAENTLAVSSHGRGSLSISRQALAQGRVKTTNTVAGVSTATHLMSCGHPLGDTQVVIVDPEQRRALPDDEVGEIWVAGASKCQGYWNNPEATAEVFQARLAEQDGERSAREHLRTGDMGFLHAGELYVCGRRKDMIIVRGQNLYPQDIEAVVELASGAVRAGGVAAFEVGDDDERTIAVVAEQASVKAPPDGPAIIAAVRNHLGAEVGRIVFVPPKSIPKTSSGKIRRFMTRQMLADGQFHVLHQITPKRPIGDEAGQTDLEGPFAAVRSRYRLKGDESFSLADAGLDSLDLIGLLHELTEILAANGAGELADKVDVQLVQDLGIAELFGPGSSIRERPHDGDGAIAPACLRPARGGTQRRTQDDARRPEARLPAGRLRSRHLRRPGAKGAPDRRHGLPGAIPAHQSARADRR